MTFQRRPTADSARSDRGNPFPERKTALPTKKNAAAIITFSNVRSMALG
jgi:hypothetical protein